MAASAGLVANVEQPALRRDGAAPAAAVADAVVLEAVHREPAASPKPVLGAPGGSHVQQPSLVLHSVQSVHFTTPHSTHWVRLFSEGEKGKGGGGWGVRLDVTKQTPNTLLYCIAH